MQNKRDYKKGLQNGEPIKRDYKKGLQIERDYKSKEITKRDCKLKDITKSDCKMGLQLLQKMIAKASGKRDKQIKRKKRIAKRNFKKWPRL